MKRTILKCVAFVVLYITIIALFVITFGKGPINWRNTSNFPVPDTVYIHDTVKIIDPTPASETFLGYDTAMLERADKRADIGENNDLFYVESQGNTGKNLPISGGIDSAPDINVASKSAHITNEVGKSVLKEGADTVGKLQASYGQVSDSVPVLVPITQRVYKDSTCTVWVSGYNPTVDSVHVYRSVAYYPVVSDKEYEPPNIVLTVGPYMGFGNKGFNYGIALTVGFPIELKKVIRRL